MPLDFSMLLNTSPPSYLPLASPFDYIDSEPPFACRRVASFPMVNRHFPKPSNLKTRSISENNINGNVQNGLTLQDFKRELSLLLESEEKSRRSSVSTQDEAPSPVVTSPSKVKKRVGFADEVGKELFTIREMLEPSDVPPKLTSPIVRAILGIDDLADIEARPAAQWVLGFVQPASEYMQFREKIDANSVALENVVIKNDSCRLAGTVKVKNLSFEKEVLIRYTDNQWRSYNDRPCKFIPSKARTADIYDTFQFDLEIPCDDENHQIIEFCICYRTDGQEFWDSNGGENFRIVSEQYRLKQMHNQPTTGHTSVPHGNRHRSNSPSGDAYSMDSANWTEFSSWSDLQTEGPYW